MIHSIEVPNSILTSEVLSLKGRVLIAMIYSTYDDGTIEKNAAGICELLGLVDAGGVPTRQGLKAVRQARQALNKQGVLTARQVPNMVFYPDYDHETQEHRLIHCQDGLKWVWTVNL